MEDSVYKSIIFEIRENQMPYFEKEEIEYCYEKNGNDKDKTIYELLLIKSEDSTISVSGLNTQDTSSYFKRIASRFRPVNSGTLPGG